MGLDEDEEPADATEEADTAGEGTTSSCATLTPELAVMERGQREPPGARAGVEQ